MNGPISSNPYPNYSAPEHTYYTTPMLMQLAADEFFNPGKLSYNDRRWLASQLQQRAAAMLENDDPA